MSNSKILNGWLEKYPEMVVQIIEMVHSAAGDLYGTDVGDSTDVNVRIESRGPEGFRISTTKSGTIDKV